MNSPSVRDELAGRLRELIAALERRAPRPERTAEIGIAQDASMIRQQAIDQLERIGTSE